jgi:hypothetical protein
MYMKPSAAHLGSLMLLSLGKVHLELGNVAHEQDLGSLFSNRAEDFLILPRCAQPCPSNPVWAGHAIRELSLHMFTQSARTTAAPAFTYKRCPIHIHQQLHHFLRSEANCKQRCAFLIHAQSQLEPL